MPATLEKKPMAKKQAAIEVEMTHTAIVEVPLSPALTSVEYAARSIELTLTPEQAATLKRLWKALDEQGAQMTDGRYITRPGHAVQWLLDQVVVSVG